MAIAGVLNLLFKANTSQAQKGVKDLSKSTSTLTQKFGKLKSGLLSVSKQTAVAFAAINTAGAGLGALALKSASNVRETQKWADSLGIGAKRLDAMNMVAAKFGVEGDMVADSMKDLGIKIDLALKEGGGLTDLFRIAGIQLNKFKGISNDEKLFTFFDDLKKLDPETARTLMDEINDSMFQLGPIVKDRSVDFRKLTEEVEKSGRIMSGAQRGALLALNNSFISLKQTMGSFMNQVGARLAPTLIKAFDWISNNASRVSLKIMEIGKSIYSSFKNNVTIVYSTLKPIGGVIKDITEPLLFLGPMILDTFQIAAVSIRTLLSGVASKIRPITQFIGKALSVAFAPLKMVAYVLNKVSSAMTKQESIVAEGKVGDEIDSFFKALEDKLKGMTDLSEYGDKGDAQKSLASPLGVASGVMQSNLVAQQINPNQIRLGGQSGKDVQAQQLQQQSRLVAISQAMASDISRLANNTKRSVTGVSGISQGVLA